MKTAGWRKTAIVFWQWMSPSCHIFLFFVSRSLWRARSLHLMKIAKSWDKRPHNSYRPNYHCFLPIGPVLEYFKSSRNQIGLFKFGMLSYHHKWWNYQNEKKNDDRSTRPTRPRNEFCIEFIQLLRGAQLMWTARQQHVAVPGLLRQPWPRQPCSHTSWCLSIPPKDCVFNWKYNVW